MMKSNNTKQRNIAILILAFASVYIFWGSTYLAIKYAIETLPPFLMAGARFMFAGGVLYIASTFSKDFERPTFAHVKTSFIVGTLLLLGGNGGVVIAQHCIPSSVAALLVATEPFWIVILSWLWLKGERPSWKAVLGILVGFAGVWLLISGRSGGGGFENGQLLGAIAVVAAAAMWATGSIYGLKATTPKSSLQTAGMQMLAGGAMLFIAGSIRGEWATFDAAAVSARSLAGMVYLIVFGSLVGFTAYSWLLKNAKPSNVATYAYVNPVIAVVLGWLIASESMTGMMLVGAGVVVGSVVLITATKGEKNEADESIHQTVGRSAEARA